MKKYWKTFTLALSSTMQYRANLILWLIVAWMQPITSLLIWFAIIGDSAGVGGYGKGEMLVYYLSMTITWYLIGGVFAGQLGSDIKFGKINKTLVMPYSIVLDAAVKEQAWKVVSLVMSLPILLAAVWWGRGIVVINYSINDLLMLAITIILGALLFALIEAVVGLSAFWFVETWPISETVGVVRMLFGGILAPIPLLPEAVQQVSNYLPFRYLFYPAATLMTGTAEQPLKDIGMQAMFVVVLYLLLTYLWRKGLRRYEGIGG